MNQVGVGVARRSFHHLPPPPSRPRMGIYAPRAQKERGFVRTKSRRSVPESGVGRPASQKRRRETSGVKTLTGNKIPMATIVVHIRTRRICVLVFTRRRRRLLVFAPADRPTRRGGSEYPEKREKRQKDIGRSGAELASRRFVYRNRSIESKSSPTNNN